MATEVFIIVIALSICAYLEHRHEQKLSAIIDEYHKLERQHQQDQQRLSFTKAELNNAKQSIDKQKQQITQLKEKLSACETKEKELRKQIPSYTQQEAELHEAIDRHMQQALHDSLNAYTSKYNTSHIPYGLVNEIKARLVKEYVKEHNIKATISEIKY